MSQECTNKAKDGHQKKIGIMHILGVMSFVANAQVNGFEEVYKTFRQQAIQDYENFRDKVK